VDMGAYEFAHVYHDVSGTFTPGGTITFTSEGTPGMLTFLFIALGEAENVIPPYGTLLVDPLAAFLMVQWVSAPISIPVVIPPGLPTPLPIATQLAVFNGSLTGAGNFSNLQTFLIEDS